MDDHIRFHDTLRCLPKGVILGRALLLFAVVVGWPGTLYVAKDNGEHFNVWCVCVCGRGTLGYTGVFLFVHMDVGGQRTVLNAIL